MVPGIGPQRALALQAIGVHTLHDVLWCLPICDGNPPPVIDTGPLPPASAVQVCVRHVKARPSFGRGRRGGLETTWERADGRAISARFFAAGFLRQHLIAGEWYLLEGKTDRSKGDCLLHPSFTHLPGGILADLPTESGCRVRYRIPEGLGDKVWATLIGNALSIALACPDPLTNQPSSDYAQLFSTAHQPATPEVFEVARAQLARFECAALAWRLRQRRQKVIGHHGRAWRWDGLIDQRARQRLPFTLTPGQDEALAAIRQDLQAPQPMYRLLQGDVGSGKTALAFLAMLAVVADSSQAYLLAPTAILAHQHFTFIKACLLGSRVQVALVTGATTASERAAICAQLAEGSCHILIGTHAILGDDLQPASLGLVVIDEQHKFGVEQRATLLQRRGPCQTWHPDLLLMTATPIPRSLALTVFGDLVVTRISGKPPGRGQVRTSLQLWKKTSDVVAHLKATPHQQTFIICPLREDSDAIEAANAEDIAAALSKQWPNQVGLVHGGLRDHDKNHALAQFAAGHTRMLVATTVIEVGIDIPEAECLMVLDAHRFGLATLHQLRGRIGRGHRDGICQLWYRDNQDAERLHTLIDNDDGIAIAEADLRARGPGALLGTSQHGSLRLRVADLSKDLALLAEVSAEVDQAIQRGQTMPIGLQRLAPTASPELDGG